MVHKDTGHWKYLFIVLLILYLSSCTLLHHEEPYMISGQIIDEHGEGMPGVSLLLEGDTTKTLLTNEKGYWTAEVKGYVQIKPMSEDFIFSPVVHTTSIHHRSLDFLALERKSLQVEVAVSQIEFGKVIVSRFQLLEIRHLPEAQYFTVLSTFEDKGLVREIGTSLFQIDSPGEVTLAILDQDKRILATTVIPTGLYTKTFPLLYTTEEVMIRDQTIHIEAQSLVGVYLAEGVLPHLDNEGEEVEVNIVLQMGGEEGGTDLDEEYFLINQVAIEYDFAFDEPDRFSVIFTSKFESVDYIFDDLDLYIYANHSLIDAKENKELSEEETSEIKTNIVKIYNRDHRGGRQRATARVSYWSRKDVGLETVFNVNVIEVMGLRKATGFTILKPDESHRPFDTEIQRNTSEDVMTVYILGEESPDFAGGLGTPTSPYLINNAEQLNNIRHYLNDHFKLTADIDLRELNNTQSNSFGMSNQNQHSWDPIGSYYNIFTGSIDGNGFVIQNLTIHREESVDVGLFGYTGSSSVIRRVVLENVDIKGQRHVGALVGRNEGEIIDCRAQGEVAGTQFVGGLVGVNWEKALISGSRTHVEVVGEDDYIGGLVGANLSSSIIEESTAYGDVSGENIVGGLVGSSNEESEIYRGQATGDVKGRGRSIGGLVGLNTNSDILESEASGKVEGEGVNIGGLVGLNQENGYISNSSFTGDAVKGSSTVGGLVGLNWSGSIVNSYVTSTVEGNSNIGGLVGFNWEQGSINNSYVTGDVDASGNRVGGLVGRNDYIIDNSYYRGGEVKGEVYVGLFVGVNWDNGMITDSYAMGVVEGTEYVSRFVGFNQSQTWEYLFSDMELFLQESRSAVSKGALETTILLDEIPQDKTTIYLAPQETTVSHLKQGDSHQTITSLQGDGKTRRIPVPLVTGSYRVSIIDSYDNRVESYYELNVQNVDDVLNDTEEYRSALFGEENSFTLDRAPLEGVTAWIAPQNTLKQQLDDENTTMTSLEGDGTEKEIPSPETIGDEYHLYLLDEDNNFVVSEKSLTIGHISNEDLTHYYITLHEAIDDEETTDGHTIKLYYDYRLPHHVSIPKELTLHLGGQRLAFDGYELSIDHWGSMMKDGDVVDSAVLRTTEETIVRDLLFNSTLRVMGACTVEDVTIGDGTLILDDDLTIPSLKTLTLNHTDAAIEGDGNLIKGEGRLVLALADRVMDTILQLHVEIRDDVEFQGVTASGLLTIEPEKTLSFTGDDSNITGATLVLTDRTSSIVGSNTTNTLVTEMGYERQVEENALQVSFNKEVPVAQDIVIKSTSIDLSNITDSGIHANNSTAHAILVGEPGENEITVQILNTPLTTGGILRVDGDGDSELTINIGDTWEVDYDGITFQTRVIADD